MNTSAKHLMKFILPAAAVLVFLAVLTAGCVSGDDTTDPETAILGDWKYTFANDDGSETVLNYHFDADMTGTVATAKTTSPLHWVYDEDQKMYMVNYDALMKQEYFAYGKDGNKEYLCSVGGGYILTKA